MKICSVCGTHNEDEVDYCKDCGADLSGVSTSPDQAENEEAPPVEEAAVEEVAEAGAVVDDEEPEDAVSTDVTDAATDGDETPQPSGPHLVVVSTGEKIPLAKPEIIIGREDPISNIFPDIDTTPFGGLEGGVSRKHAKITEQGGQYHIEDLNSTNYTLVNKEKLEPSTTRQLSVGDEVRLGRVALLFMI